MQLVPNHLLLRRSTVQLLQTLPTVCCLLLSLDSILPQHTLLLVQLPMVLSLSVLRFLRAMLQVG